MKRSVFLWCIILLFPPMFGQTEVSQPDSVYYFEWHNCWVVSQIQKYVYTGTHCIESTVEQRDYSTVGITIDTTRFTYDSQGRLLEREYRYNTKNYKHVYSYNGNDSLLTDFIYCLDGGVWVPQYRDSISYNEQGLRQETIRSNNDSMVNYTTWNYDNNGRLVEEIEGYFNGSVRVYNTKTSYVFNGNLLSEVISSFYTYLYGYDSIIDNSKTVFTYSNAILTKKEELHRDGLGGWDKRSFEEYTYDASGIRNQIKYFKYYTLPEVVAPTFTEIININKDEEIYERISYSWRFHAWEKKSKTVTFSHNSAIQNNGLELCGPNTYEVKLEATCTDGIEQYESDQLLLYPNPSNGDITFRLNEGLANNCTAKVISLEGKTVFVENYSFLSSQGEQTIQLKNIHSGLYFVQIITNNKVYQEKILIDIQ